MPIASDNYNRGDEALNKFSGKVKALKGLSEEPKIKNPPKSVSVAGNGNSKEAEEACSWTECDIPMRKGNCNVLLIAPHGHPDDDEKTYEIARLAADELDCYAIINQTFKKPPKKKDPKTGKIKLYKNGNPIRHDPNKKKKWFNLNRIDQVHDHLESEFEKPLLNIVNNIIEKYGKALVLWIHGIDDENLTPENTDGNVDGIDALIGIGQGNPDHPTAYQRTVNKLVSTLKTNPLSPLNAALAEKGSNYCGWHENIMNQFLGAKGYSLDKVESIQIELRKIGFRQKDNFENTAMALENSLFAIAIRPATESEQPHLDSAVQKGSLRQIEAGKIDLDNDQFMSRLDHITSDKVKFNTLVASISKNGILNNIIVRRRSDANGRPYQLISGFRRMAAFQATIPEKDKFSNAIVPARVLDESVSDDEAYRFSFTENLARQDLSLWEVARSCEKIRKELDDGNKQKGEIEEHLANLIQKNTRTVRRYLRLASLDNETITNAVHTEDISPTMALDLGSRELEADEIEALLSHVKNYPKTTRTFKRFYENLEYCCDLSKLSVAGVLKCKSADSFLSLDRQDLEDRIAYLRNKSNKPDSEILQGKTGSLVKDVAAMEAEATNKSLQNRFVKTSERLSQKVSKAFEKSKIDAQFKIKPNLRSQKKMVALTISMPVDQIHKAIDVVSSEVANKFAVAPLIISASRRNDTPACHSEWFMEGLKRGYLGVSTGGSRYVLFEKARLIVFWTKNPEPMFKYLDEINQKRIGYYFQYTLNDYEKEKLEPNIPSLEERIETFKTLSDKIGKEKVIWRFDPLVLTDTIAKEQLVEKVENLMEKLEDSTEKLVISFYRSDDYKHALKRMQKSKINPRDFDAGDIAFVAKQLGALGEKYKMKVATCADKGDKGDLSLFGIDPNKCIDDELIKRVFKDDKILMSFLDSKKNLKDPGQRKECKCIVSKDIGSINTCANECLYCYANKSDKAVKINLGRIENGEIGEFLIPPKSPKKL